MTLQRTIWIGCMLFSATAIALSACTHDIKSAAATPAATVVILGNKVQPSPKCTCEDAERRARAWKTYAIKLETQLGIPASSSSGGLP